MSYTYQKEVENGQGAELAEQIHSSKRLAYIYDYNTIIINT
jgi:hypothetical protein